MQETTATPFDLTITGSGVDQCRTVVLRGNLEGPRALRLAVCLERLRALGCRRLVLDIAAVPFVDAAGIAVLFRAAKDARRGGDVVILQDPSRRLLQLLEITLLASVFSIERSVDQVA